MNTVAIVEDNAVIRKSFRRWIDASHDFICVLACATAPDVLDRLISAYRSALAVLDGLTPDELDRPFVLVAWEPDAQSVTSTLRRRVLRTAADHLREHHVQIAETLVRWRE